jgi:Outer membrane protein beta-barrel domain
MRYLLSVMISLAIMVPMSSLSAEFVRGPYVGVELNRAMLDDQSSALAPSYLPASSYNITLNSQTTAITGGRVFFGYKVHENIDLEAAYYQDQGVNVNYGGTDITDNTVTKSVNIFYKARGFDYSILFRPSIFTGMNGLFLRLGGHTSIVDYNQLTTTTYSDRITPTDTKTKSGSLTNSGYFGGIGYDLVINKNFSMRTEFTYTPNLNGAQVRRINVGLKYAVE